MEGRVFIYLEMLVAFLDCLIVRGKPYICGKLAVAEDLWRGEFSYIWRRLLLF